MKPSLTNPQPTQRPRRPPWRMAALTAASTVALAACGASAAGTTSAPTSSTQPAAASGTTAPASPGSATAPTTAATPAPTATAAVGIVNFAFTPAKLTVKAGTTVVWTNKDAIAHTVNFATGGINSNVLNQNDQFTHTFTTPGTYDYICSIHPFMHGTVTVTA